MKRVENNLRGLEKGFDKLKPKHSEKGDTRLEFDSFTDCAKGILIKINQAGIASPEKIKNKNMI